MVEDDNLRNTKKFIICYLLSIHCCNKPLPNARVFLRFSKISKQAVCMHDHIILHGKLFSTGHIVVNNFAGILLTKASDQLLINASY